MKLVIAIIDKSDAQKLGDGLRKEGFYFTNLSSTGGFLGQGNTTLLLGLEEDKLQQALDCIKAHCHRRTVNRVVGSFIGPGGLGTGEVVPIDEGGATVFVVEAEQFLKM